MKDNNPTKKDIINKEPDSKKSKLLYSGDPLKDKKAKDKKPRLNETIISSSN